MPIVSEFFSELIYFRKLCYGAVKEKNYLREKYFQIGFQTRILRYVILLIILTILDSRKTRVYFSEYSYHMLVIYSWMLIYIAHINLAVNLNLEHIWNICYFVIEWLKFITCTCGWIVDAVGIWKRRIQLYMFPIDMFIKYMNAIQMKYINLYLLLTMNHIYLLMRKYLDNNLSQV